MDFRKNGGKYLVTIEVIILIIVLVLGVLHFIIPGGSKNKTSADGKNNAISGTEYIWSATETGSDTETGQTTADAAGNTAVIQVDENVAQAEFSEAVEQKIAEMSVEQKVCQLFITRPEEVTGVTQFTQAGKKTQESLAAYPLGRYVFGTGNFNGVTATRNIMANINKYVNTQKTIPMFLAVNEAGGDNSPLAAGNAYEVQPAMSGIKTAEEAKTSSGKISEYMNESMLNMNLAIPVSTSGECAAAFVDTYNAAGIYTAAGIFPGENVSDIKSAETSYKAITQTGVSALIVGNYSCKNLTGDETMPCSVSTKTVGYIRNSLGYNGIIMTADLSAGVSGNYKADKAAVSAVKAGVDMIYVSTGFADCYNAVLTAVQSGDISQDILDQAVGRIITCKMGE